MWSKRNAFFPSEPLLAKSLRKLELTFWKREKSLPQQQQQQQQQHQQSYICVNLIQASIPWNRNQQMVTNPNHQLTVLREVVVSSQLALNILVELDITGESPRTSKNDMFETNNFTKCRLNQSILHKHATQRKQQDNASNIARAPGHPFCSAYWPSSQTIANST